MLFINIWKQIYDSTKNKIKDYVVDMLSLFVIDIEQVLENVNFWFRLRLRNMALSQSFLFFPRMAHGTLTFHGS